MAKVKRFSYAGIPANHRAQVMKLLHLQAAGLDWTGDDPQTPQEAWAALNAHWTKQREEAQAKKDKYAKDRAEGVREYAIADLDPALKLLRTCRSLALAIEEEGDDSYLSNAEMGAFVRMGIDVAGKELEQALCNLGLIPENDAGQFVNELKSEGVKFEPKAEEEEEATA